MMNIQVTFKSAMKALIVLTIFLSLIAISSCENKIQKEAYTVGIVLFGDSRLPQVNGFKDGLRQLGYMENDTIKYVVRNAKNKRPKLKQLVQELIDQGVDLLVAAGGLEADTMKKMVGDNNIPVVVLYVNAIIERGLVQTRRDPGWNVTGIDNLNAELSGKRIELMQDLLPRMKKVLVLYYQKIAPSRIGVERARETAEMSNLIIDARAVSSRDEIKNTMKKLVAGEVDAMLTVPTAPIDNALKDFILPHVARLKIPLMTHSKPLAEAGALASYGSHFYDLGIQAARLADKVLDGVAASSIPFETPKDLIYTLNKDVQSDVGIKINGVARNQIDEYIVTKK